MTTPKRVLFVCMGNACRSQIAEALARHQAPRLIIAMSAGVSPLGYIPDPTRLVLLEQGIGLNGHYSKGVGDPGALNPDLIINMSGIPGKALFAPSAFEDWDVADPYGEDLESYRRVREDIEERLDQLVARLRDEATEDTSGGR